MHASDEPIVDVPIAFSASGAFQRLAIIFQQRVSIAAVWGYSSLSTMFLSADSEYSREANGSIQVPTNVARLRRALPSSMASSWTIWYAVSGSVPTSGSRSREKSVASPSRANIGFSWLRLPRAGNARDEWSLVVGPAPSPVAAPGLRSVMWSPIFASSVRARW